MGQATEWTVLRSQWESSLRIWMHMRPGWKAWRLRARERSRNFNSNSAEDPGGKGRRRKKWRKSNHAEDTWVPRLKCPLSISGKETYPRHSVWNSEQQRERETLRSFQINISYNGQESVHFSRTILIIGQESNFFKVLRDIYSAPRIPFPAGVSFKMKSQMTNTDSEGPWNVPD